MNNKKNNKKYLKSFWSCLIATITTIAILGGSLFNSNVAYASTNIDYTFNENWSNVCELNEDGTYTIGSGNIGYTFDLAENASYNNFELEIECVNDVEPDNGDFLVVFFYVEKNSNDLYCIDNKYNEFSPYFIKDGNKYSVTIDIDNSKTLEYIEIQSSSTEDYIIKSIKLDDNYLIGGINENQDNIYAIETNRVSVETCFEIKATDIKLTVPLNVSMVIDPNIENGFIASDLVFQNDTPAPVVVSIDSFSNIDAPFLYDILPEELPQGLSWDKLNADDTLKYFSLGLDMNTFTNWKSSNLINDFYVKDFNTNGKTVLGVIDGKNNANIGFKASYGKSFKTAQNFSYNLTFSATLE